MRSGAPSLLARRHGRFVRPTAAPSARVNVSPLPEPCAEVSTEPARRLGEVKVETPIRSAKRAPRRLRGLSTSDLRLSRKDYPKTERRGVDSARLGRVRVEAGFFHACLDFVALRDRTCRTACSSARESHAAEARHGLHAPKTTLESRRAARAWLLPAKRTGFSAPRPLLMARFA